MVVSQWQDDVKKKHHVKHKINDGQTMTRWC